MRKRTLIPLILLILIIGGVWYLDSNKDKVSPDPVDNVDTSSWSTFTSDKYNFEIDYPVNDWNMAVKPDDRLAPKFSFYIKPAGVPVKAPFDHFANITHVSVYPEGIPTEGLIGQTTDLEGDWGENISDESRLYLLEDGTPFAAYIKFNEKPDSWNGSGFAWARLKADNFESVCFQDGVEMEPNDQCDPLGDESITIRHRGEVNEDIWPSLKASVRSINFN